MKTGTVKFYNRRRDFGFILEEETGNEIFVHASGLQDKIKEKDKVTFDVIDGKKGLNAVSVKLVNPPVPPTVSPSVPKAVASALLPAGPAVGDPVNNPVSDAVVAAD